MKNNSDWFGITNKQVDDNREKYDLNLDPGYENIRLELLAALPLIRRGLSTREPCLKALGPWKDLGGAVSGEPGRISSVRILRDHAGASSFLRRAIERRLGLDITDPKIMAAVSLLKDSELQAIWDRLAGQMKAVASEFESFLKEDDRYVYGVAYPPGLLEWLGPPAWLNQSRLKEIQLIVDQLHRTVVSRSYRSQGSFFRSFTEDQDDDSNYSRLIKMIAIEREMVLKLKAAEVNATSGDASQPWPKPKLRIVNPNKTWLTNFERDFGPDSLEKIMDLFPKEIISLVPTIEIMFRQHDPRLYQASPHSGVSSPQGQYFWVDNRVQIFADQVATGPDLIRALAELLGHAFDYNHVYAQELEGRVQFLEAAAGAPNKLTEADDLWLSYQKNLELGLRADFAKTFATCLLEPQRLQRLDPARYQAMKFILGAAFPKMDTRQLRQFYARS